MVAGVSIQYQAFDVLLFFFSFQALAVRFLFLLARRCAPSLEDDSRSSALAAAVVGVSFECQLR